MKKRAYISGSLSSLPDDRAQEMKAFYERILAALEEVGMEGYLPHLHSDPEKHADMPNSEVYRVDKKEVLDSELLLCEMSIPSHGVGGEIEIATEAGNDVLLIWKEGVRVGRFSRGNPDITHMMTYTDFDDAITQLKTWLTDYAS
jgi:hypothetical protein